MSKAEKRFVDNSKIEAAQPGGDSHSKNRGGKKLN